MSPPTRRGRPPKYGTSSKIVAITLPQPVVDALAEIDADLGWAIVRLVEQRRRTPPTKRTPGLKRADASAVAVAELVSVGGGQSLIVVNSAVVRTLPGVQMLALSETQAFLSLGAGQGMADLELAVLDRLEQLHAAARRKSPEISALEQLLAQLRRWRRNERMSWKSRAIVLVENRE